MRSGDAQSPGEWARPRSMAVSVWGNPLARPSDRGQVAFAVLLIFLWVLAIPVAATAGSILWAEGSATAGQESGAKTQGTATLLIDAPLPQISVQGVTINGPLSTLAKWRAADGSERTGPIDVGTGLAAGDTIAIWLDSSGAVTDPPPATVDVAAQAIGIAAGGWLAVGAVLGALFWLARRHWDRARWARWDDEWLRVEPRWSDR